MPQMTIELPDELAQRLARFAAELQRSPEQVAVETLDSGLQDAEEKLAQRYAEFFRDSGLFRQISEEEKQRYTPVSDEELAELAEKLGKFGPLSEVIIADRGPR